MAYNKQTWVDYPNLSSPITADRLNHMEDGIEEAYNHGGGGGGVSVGTILPYSGSTIPNGFMLCDGSAISRTTYAELFSIIGTTYGAGDGSTTFNIPDLKGKVGVGIDSNDTDFDTLGETGGEKTHTLTIQEMPSHYHDENYGSARWIDSGGLGEQGSGNKVTYSGGGSEKINITANTGGGQAHNNLQPYVVLNYIIKSSSTSSVEAQIVNEYSTNTTDAYSCNYVNNITKEVYSTDEVKINKVWIDGKPIYRKIFEGTANIQQTGSSQPIANLPSDSETIINLYGYFKWSSYLQTFPIVWGTSSCSLRVVGKSIQYFSNFGIGTGTYIIISEYTKTTD